MLIFLKNEYKQGFNQQLNELNEAEKAHSEKEAENATTITDESGCGHFRYFADHSLFYFIIEYKQVQEPLLFLNTFHIFCISVNDPKKY